MNTHHKSERGQALILIAVAMVALISLTALAVDGGNIYAERRRAQNAADTTVLDAALAKVRGGNLYTEGLARAASNNYIDSDPTAGSSSADVNVEVHNPPYDGPYSNCASPDFDCNDYIQVFITAQVDTFFAGILGWNSVTNKVEAVARALPPSEITEMFAGEAIVGLSPHDCQAFKFQGTADTVITGSGIYVNSDCETEAFFNASNAGSLTAPCLNSVGGIAYNPGVVNIPLGCMISGASPLGGVEEPNPACATDAVVTGPKMSPGNYTDNASFPPAGVTELEPGIYCITKANFRMNANEPLTGIGVVIRVEQGDIRLEGGNANLSAPTEGPFEGLLLFIPSYNGSEIVVNGNAEMNLTGTIMAIASDITLNGTADGTNLYGQVIGYTVKLTGTGYLNLTYNADQNYSGTTTTPSIELTQ